MTKSTYWENDNSADDMTMKELSQACDEDEARE